MPSPWPADAPEQFLRCPSIALDAEKNLVSGCGIFCGGLLYTAVAGLGGPPGQGIFNNIFIFSGLTLWMLCVIVAAGGVSRAVLTELNGEPRMGLLEVASYVRGRWTRLVLIPVALLGLALAGIVAQTFMAIFGNLPAIGPILYALSFTLGVALSMLAVLVSAVFVLGSPLFPAAVAAQDTGVSGVIRELFGLFRRRPGSILLVEGALVVASGAVTLVVGAILRVSLWLTVANSELAMKERFLRVVYGLPGPLHPLFERLAGQIPPYFPSGDEPASYPFAGFLLGLSFLGLLSAAFAYPLTLLATGGTVLYMNLRSMEGADHS